MIWYTETCSVLTVSVRVFLPLKLYLSFFADIGQDSNVRKPFTKRRQTNSESKPIGAFNASIIMIKIKNRPISRLYNFCKTNQVSKDMYFFLVLLFSVYYVISAKKNPKSHSSVRVYFFAHYIAQFSGCAS